MSLHVYEVIVGNVGLVHVGYNEAEARKVYGEYKDISRSGVGRAGNERVTLFKDDRTALVFFPDLVEETS